MQRFLQSFLQNLFMIIDNKMRNHMGIQPLAGSPYGLIHYNYITFEGNPVQLPDGTTINKGDILGELHFSNIGIASGQLGNTTITSELQLLGIARSEIALLSTLVKENKIDSNVKAFYSISLFGPGAKRIGFTICPIPQTFKIRRITLWMSILRKVFAPEFTNKAKKHTKHTEATEIWISRKKLLEM